MLNNILIVTSTYIEIDKETNCKQKESQEIQLIDGTIEIYKIKITLQLRPQVQLNPFFYICTTK